MNQNYGFKKRKNTNKWFSFYDFNVFLQSITASFSLSDNINYLRKVFSAFSHITWASSDGVRPVFTELRRIVHEKHGHVNVCCILRQLSELHLQMKATRRDWKLLVQRSRQKLWTLKKSGIYLTTRYENFSFWRLSEWSCSLMSHDELMTKWSDKWAASKLNKLQCSPWHFRKCSVHVGGGDHHSLQSEH